MKGRETILPKTITAAAIVAVAADAESYPAASGGAHAG
jgi:hypothetical protein